MFYTYELVDPRDGSVFYIGKGKGSRLHQHEREALADKPGRKCDHIRAIIASGFRPEARITKHFQDERDAYRHEASLIRAGPRTLLNIAFGGFGGKGRFASGKKEAIKALRDMRVKIAYVEAAIRADLRIVIGPYDITKVCQEAITTLRNMSEAPA